MSDASTVQRGSLPHDVADLLRNPTPVILNGPSGCGKSHLLRAISVVLEDRKVPSVYVSATAPNALERLTGAPEHAVVLLDDYELASFDVLFEAGRRILAGAPSAGTVTDGQLNPDYTRRTQLVYERLPELRPILENAHPVRVGLLSDVEVARLVHQHSPERLDSVTVCAIQQLAWGRPAWALTLLQLHRGGLLTTAPTPRIPRTHTNDLYLSSLQGPARIAEAALDAEEIASALALSELAPRSLNGVADIIGSAAQASLYDAGLLLAHPAAPELFSVPELYAVAIRDLTDAATVTRVYSDIATRLLSQEVFGIPLPDQEAAFCAHVLNHRDPRLAEDPMLSEQHAIFLHRIIGDLISFGDGERARDLLLRLGPHGPGICQLTRARFTTVLRDAHTGLQSLFTGNLTRGNCDLPASDPVSRLGMLALRGRLAAESGLPLELDPDIAPDDAEWNDALLVVRRWNDEQPLGADTAALLRIAHGHARPEVGLLAEQLLVLEASLTGSAYREFSLKAAEQRIAQLAINAPDTLRDLVSGLVVTQHLICFLSSGYVGEEQRVLNLIDSIPGGSRHRIWLTHLQAARTAFICADLERARSEWVCFAANLPRFIPYRLQAVIAKMGRIEPQDGGMSELEGYPVDYVSQTTAYFAGCLELVNLDALGAGSSSELVELPELAPIRAHVAAFREQNPLALMRAADLLENRGYWAPATYALQEARRIFLRRRASGSVAAADDRLAAIRLRTAEQVPWFDGDALPEAPKERLTPRETATAKHAAAGLSNREIAERLSCSVRTVESHLAQARAKLGVSNRESLGERLVALGIPVEARG